MPKKNETPLLSPKFALALQFANDIHGCQIDLLRSQLQHPIAPSPHCNRIVTMSSRRRDVFVIRRVLAL